LRFPNIRVRVALVASSDVLYLRVHSATKTAAMAYANTRGLRLSAAATELIELGLQAAQDASSVTALEQHVADLQADLVKTKAQLQAEQQLRAQAEQRNQMLEQAVGAWQARAGQAVGRCAKCQGALSGADLLVSGSCPRCGQAVGTQLASSASQGLDQQELLLVLGAAGLLLGLLAASRGGG
jgi:uncharacterized small protein (DUF1192 family)/predicted RNA-binding Zn-ribbon protein involved in translation (DUF1610 family)